VLVLAVVVVCVVPEPPDPVAVRHADKLYHVAGYALLAAWSVQLFAPPTLWLRLLGLLALGVGLEGVQALLPWRSADALDAVANAAGVGLGALLAFTPLARSLQWFERCIAGGARTGAG
jgi:VanZ family protein